MDDILRLEIQLPGYEKLIDASEASEKLKESFKETEDTARTMSTPSLFTDFFSTFNYQLKQTMQFMERARKGVLDNSADNNSYTRSLRASEYEFGARQLQALSHDYSDLTDLSKQLTTLSKSFSQADFTKLSNAATKIRSLAMNLGTLYSANASRFSSLVNDDSYVNTLMDMSKGSSFRRIYDNLFEDMDYFKQKRNFGRKVKPGEIDT